MPKKSLAKNKARKRGRRKPEISRRALDESYNPQAIVGFIIRELFGYIDYDLKIEPGQREKFAKLTILYGLNGTGKTTILKLAFHILSPEPRKGHKSVVTKTSFKSFQINLMDGTAVIAERPMSTAGSFTLKITKPRREPIAHVFVAVGDPPSIPGDRQESPSYDVVMGALKEIASTFFFVTDDRRINVELQGEALASVPIEMEEDEGSVAFRLALARGERESVAVTAALSQVIPGLEQQYSRKAARLSSVGFASAHSVYADMIKKIVNPQIGRPPGRKRNLPDLLSRLRRLGDDSKKFEKYGLSSKLDVAPLINVVNRAATGYKKGTIRNILDAYIEGLERRFNSLSSMYQSIDTLVDYLNNFLYPKVAIFRVDEGLILLSPNGIPLRPPMLSSGERHLLLILCSAALCSPYKAIFIVDEPEISLNIEWQRKLLRTLLGTIGNSKVQFLMASHSIPLITEYDEHVLELHANKTIK